LIIGKDVLPGVPEWRDSAQQSDAFRLTVCGVDLEPKAAASTARARFSQSPVGPFLEEYVRVHDDGTASKVLTELAAAVPGCSRYSAKGNLPSSPEAEFTVTPFPGEGLPEGAVAWRQRTVGERPLTSDVAVLVRDGMLLAFVSYDLRGDADPAVLVAAVGRAHQLP